LRVRVRIPATSANLGPGFDALGLALALYNEVTATEADSVSVSLAGPSGGLPTGSDNLVVRGVRMAYEAAARPFKGVALACVNRIPTARGLGSSAAAWVGGLVAGNALLGAPLSREALLALATRAEGHPDNVTAALCGGLTVSCVESDGRVIALSLPVPAALRWVVLVPELTNATAEARSVLPDAVPRADAVFNIQRVALLLAALQGERAPALAAALDDRLHQPYRQRLFPWMPAIVAAARAAGALGCVLSGAGPSLLAVVSGDADPVARAMESGLARAGIPGVARAFAVDTEGARLLGDGR
jgi:homoserine kinase